MEEVIYAEWGKVDETGERYVRYIHYDGTDSYNMGGRVAWRNNNPGNIKCGNFANEYGAVGCDRSGFAIFPAWEKGTQAKASLLRYGEKYRDATIEGAINTYAPKNENPTEKYIQYIEDKTGMSRTKNMSEMSDAEFQNFLKAMSMFEDSTPGYSIIGPGDGTYYRQDYLLKEKGTSPKNFSNYKALRPYDLVKPIKLTPKDDSSKMCKIPVEIVYETNAA
ncbi:hypothetical protein MCHI_000622 [Candidatus Magnetoovum chiemensis]|nr:hypothetical protein MCHI_000622 [Candidatus Magnetoovum chiemensis]